MSTHFTLDRESFQKLLGGVFLVQEYLDSQKAKRPAVDVPPKPAITEQPKEAIPPDYAQLLSAIVEVQRLIATDKPDVDGAMALIADRARNVANATGVAIGLLEGDDLVYRAGSGSAATYIGRHVKATLSVSAHNLASGEILRVENAQTDARIEAAICRQFGAQALLIVPIYHGQAVAGAVEILFSDAHGFQDREVRTYQLLAGLVAEAMSRAAQLTLKQALAAEHAKGHPHLAETPTAVEVSAAATESSGLSAFRPQVGTAAMITQGAKRLPLHKRWWKPAVAAMVTLLLMAGWIAYTTRGPVSPVASSALPRSNAIEQQMSFAPAKLVPAHSTSERETAPVPKQEKKNSAARTTPQRLRGWGNQVDYIAEDVTVRYFTPKPVAAPHFQPAASAAQPVAQGIQPPVMAHATDKPEIKQIRAQDKKCGQGRLGGRLACWLHKAAFPIRKLRAAR
jgi:GAF domain